MRYTTIQTSVDPTSSAFNRVGEVTVVYRGQVSGATQVELFIDGRTNARLVPERGTSNALMITASSVINNGNALNDLRYVTVSCNSAGVLVLNNNVQVITGAGVTPAALSAQLSTASNTDNNLFIDIVQQVGTLGQPGYTPGFLRLQHRAAAGTVNTAEVRVSGTTASLFIN